MLPFRRRALRSRPEAVPENSSKTLVRASLLALTDLELNDGNALCMIYALAIKHRLDGVRSDEIDDMGDDDPLELTPSIGGRLSIDRPARSGGASWNDRYFSPDSWGRHLSRSRSGC